MTALVQSQHFEQLQWMVADTVALLQTIRLHVGGVGIGFKSQLVAGSGD